MNVQTISQFLAFPPVARLLFGAGAAAAGVQSVVQLPWGVCRNPSKPMITDSLIDKRPTQITGGNVSSYSYSDLGSHLLQSSPLLLQWLLGGSTCLRGALVAPGVSPSPLLISSLSYLL